jgi:outer membrane protein OmpA-like peptidoglycan-associated protein
LTPLALTLALLLPAAAQSRPEDIDAHGTTPPPLDGDPRAPLMMWSPDRHVPGALSGGLVFEYDDDLLSIQVQNSPDVTDLGDPIPLLDDLFGANLQLAYGISERFGVGVAAPLWLHSVGPDGGQGLAPGDLVLSAPIGLVMPDVSGVGPGLSLVPQLGMPTGKGKWSLGERGLFGSLAVVGGWTTGPLALDANLALGNRNWAEMDNVRGGAALRGGLAVGFVPGEGAFGVHLETTLDHGLAKARNGTAIEGFVTARGRVASGLWWTGGLGRGLNSGIGTANLRVYAGVGFAPPVRETDVIVPIGPAGFVGTTFKVVDRDGKPIAGPSLAIGGRPAGQEIAPGQLAVETVAWKKGVAIAAPGFVGVTVPTPTNTGPGVVDVVLDWAPTPVAVHVRDQNGVAVSATVAIEGQSFPIPPLADGQTTFDLPEGTWTLSVDHAELGRQTRELVVHHGDRPLDVEVLLGPSIGGGELMLDVRDTEGNAIPGARMVVDGRPLGTFSTGPHVEVDELAEGPHRIEVSADGFQTLEKQEVNATPGSPANVPFVLARMPGSVRVVARGPDGAVLDASVRFDGKTTDGQVVRLAQEPLGQYGERIFVLRPGSWTVLVASPTYGLQQRGLVVPPDDTRLITVDVVLQPSEEGDAKLALRVVDPDGNPVDGAAITLDGKGVGTTSTGGTIDLAGLDSGERELALTAPHFRSDDHAIVLTPGLQEKVVTLAWEAGTVRVTARTATGPVGDATARFAGPGTVAPLALGSDGEEFDHLEPGTWNVLVASATLGLRQRQVVVPPDSRSLIPVDVLLTPSEGGNADVVVNVTDPEGRAVAGAHVTLDGTDLGTTSGGGSLELQALDAGSRVLDVTAVPYVEYERKVTLNAGTQQVGVVLAWAPGAVKIVTKAGGVPVTDAVVRLAGPAVMKPTPVDGNGERLFALQAGRWQAVVVSPKAGLAQREIVIAEAARGLQTVVIDLPPATAGAAELLVRVQDPDGKPVPGAKVSIGGQERGTASAGGALLVGDLQPGKATLEVTAPDFQAIKLDGVELAEGGQERIVTLDWKPRTVQVVVKNPAGEPIDAEIRFEGPADVSPASTGGDGTGEFALRPGSWQVMASTADRAMKRQTVDVAPGTDPQVVAFVLDAASHAGVTTTQVVLKEQVLFDFNSAVLKPDANAILDEVAAILIAHSDIARVEVQGHTDDIGTVEVNYALSQARADAVVAALVRRGVAAERLVAQGYGPTRPLVPNADDDARAKNRRVQFDITEKSR